jgi:MFS transporter, DHA1 family, multidrug resistance protein
MRSSEETDRTHIPSQVPSRIPSPDPLETLEEKNTRMSNQDPHMAELEQFRSSHQQFDSLDDRFGNETEDETARNASDEESSDKDLERGNVEREKKHEEPPKDPNLIVWDGPNDPENPMNWPASKKWIITVALGMMTFCVTFASSVFSNATVPTSIEFGVSTEVTTLGTSLFVLGFAVGPLVSKALRPTGK